MLDYEMLKGGRKEKRHSCPHGSERTGGDILALECRGALLHNAELTWRIRFRTPRFPNDTLTQAFPYVVGTCKL